MKSKRSRMRSALTIIEGIIALIVLVIAVIGSSTYRYSAKMNARKAYMYITASRMASMLCDGWSGEGGDVSFDPVATFSPDLDISADSGPEAPSGFTAIGGYRIIIEGTYYYTTLSYKDLGSGLKALNVVVNWDFTGRGTYTLADAKGLLRPERLIYYVKKTKTIYS